MNSHNNALRDNIKNWMQTNIKRFIDPITGEADYAKMVGAWDLECDTGRATFDPRHIAWEIALDVADEREA